MNSVGVLNDLMPQDPVMAAAWVGSLRYVLSRDDILAAFRKQTGNNWKPAESAIDRMIDEATGVEVDFIRAFAKWHNEHIWGEDGSKPVDVASLAPDA